MGPVSEEVRGSGSSESSAVGEGSWWADDEDGLFLGMLVADCSFEASREKRSSLSSA